MVSEAYEGEDEHASKCSSVSAGINAYEDDDDREA